MLNPSSAITNNLYASYHHSYPIDLNPQWHPPPCTLPSLVLHLSLVMYLIQVYWCLPYWTEQSFFQFVLVCLGTGVCLGGWECFVEFWGSSPVLLVDMSDSFYCFITTTCVWFLHWCSVVWVLKDKLIKKYKCASGRTAKWDWICCCTVRTWVLEFFFVNHFIKDLRFPIRTVFIHNKHSLIKGQCCYVFPSLFINVRCQTVLILIQYGGVFGL